MFPFDDVIMIPPSYLEEFTLEAFDLGVDARNLLEFIHECVHVTIRVFDGVIKDGEDDHCLRLEFGTDVHVWLILHLMEVREEELEVGVVAEEPGGRESITSWWRHQMENFSALLALIPRTKASDAEFWYFFDLRLN